MYMYMLKTSLGTNNAENVIKYVYVYFFTNTFRQFSIQCIIYNFSKRPFVESDMLNDFK